MLKTLHLLFVLIAISSFIGRVILSETQPHLLKQKLFKIAPHVIDSLLLLSGIILAVQGSWATTGHGWLAAKLLALTAYIGLGAITLHSRGNWRWLAFSGAMACFVYIGMVAVTKNPFFFL